MAAIRGKDTRPELLLRSAAFALGLRFRLHVRKLPGSPDLVFPMFKAVVFVHGCFWHRHQCCRFATVPRNNASFWAEKFAANVGRDSRVRQQLREQGWRVGVVWECAIRPSPHLVASALRTWLLSEDASDIDIGSELTVNQ